MWHAGRTFHRAMEWGKDKIGGHFLSTQVSPRSCFCSVASHAKTKPFHRIRASNMHKNLEHIPAYIEWSNSTGCSCCWRLWSSCWRAHTCRCWDQPPRSCKCMLLASHAQKSGNKTRQVSLHSYDCHCKTYINWSGCMYISGWPDSTNQGLDIQSH